MEVSAIESDVVFQCLLADMLKEYEFDKNVAKQMETGQKALFRVLDWKTTSLSKAQQVLFFPMPSDMKTYIAALKSRTSKLEVSWLLLCIGVVCLCFQCTKNQLLYVSEVVYCWL